MLSEAIDVFWCERNEHHIDVHLNKAGEPRFEVYEWGMFAAALTRPEAKARISELDHLLFRWELAGCEIGPPFEKRLRDVLQTAVSRHQLPLPNRDDDLATNEKD
jgi:hypothetical protein